MDEHGLSRTTTDDDTDPSGTVWNTDPGAPILLSKAAWKGVVTVLMLVLAGLGALVGVEISVEADVFELLYHQLNAAYAAILVLAGIVGVVVRAGKNLHKNWDSVKRNGLKVRKDSTGYVFDFAPKDLR